MTRHELMVGTASGTMVSVSKTARAHIQIVFVNTCQEIGKSVLTHESADLDYVPFHVEAEKYGSSRINVKVNE